LIISLLVAMDERRGIGLENRLPWRLASDMKRFRQLTMGHHLIVGRKTYESIGKPLPGRQIIVVTRNPLFELENCISAHSIDAALEIARARGESELFVCGGADVYAATIGLADRLYLTLVHAETGADTFFPEWDARVWTEIESIDHPASEKDQHPFTFKLLARPRETG
jgi:dihydrofolate reductase